MISIFNSTDFRSFIWEKFREMPKDGYGQSLQLARHLKVHSTLVSQVLNGNKVFSQEQAYEAAEYLGLNELETDYFVLLIQIEKAGSAAWRAYLEKKAQQLKHRATDLVNRLSSERRLDDATRAVFYSHWKYSAARQLTAIPGQANLESIAKRLDLSLRAAREVIEFLVGCGLCVEANGKLQIGPTATHLESSSPWAYVNHLNWRQRAMERYRVEQRTKLHYTCPMTLSRSDAERVREMLSKLLEEIDLVIGPSPSEELHCLNIDWFQAN